MFYKIDGEMIQSANSIIGPGFSLTEENHAEHTYPVGGWHWFANAQEALAGLNSKPGRITALQGMRAIHAAGLAGAFATWRAGLDPIADFETIAFLDKSTTWERNNPILIAGTQALGLTTAQVDDLFTSAATP